jgi:hypothetical protein
VGFVRSVFITSSWHECEPANLPGSVQRSFRSTVRYDRSFHTIVLNVHLVSHKSTRFGLKFKFDQFMRKGEIQSRCDVTALHTHIVSSLSQIERNDHHPLKAFACSADTPPSSDQEAFSIPLRRPSSLMSRRPILSHDFPAVVMSTIWTMNNCQLCLSLPELDLLSLTSYSIASRVTEITLLGFALVDLHHVVLFGDVGLSFIFHSPRICDVQT